MDLPLQMRKYDKNSAFHNIPNMHALFMKSLSVERKNCTLLCEKGKICHTFKNHSLRWTI